MDSGDCTSKETGLHAKCLAPSDDHVTGLRTEPINIIRQKEMQLHY